MKAFLANSVALFLALSTGASALADNTAPLQPIAQVHVGYGFSPGPVTSREVTLFTDGSSHVVEIHVIRDGVMGPEIGRKTVEFDADYYFEPDVMTKISAAVILQTGAPIVDLDSTRPVYEDGPGFQYYAFVNEKKILIASNFGGHTSLPPSAKIQRAAKYLKADLDNLLHAISAETDAQ